MDIIKEASSIFDCDLSYDDVINILCEAYDRQTEKQKYYRLEKLLEVICKTLPWVSYKPSRSQYYTEDSYKTAVDRWNKNSEDRKEGLKTQHPDFDRYNSDYTIEHYDVTAEGGMYVELSWKDYHDGGTDHAYVTFPSSWFDLKNENWLDVVKADILEMRALEDQKNAEVERIAKEKEIEKKRKEIERLQEDIARKMLDLPR